MKPKLLLLATIGTAIWADAGCVFAGTSLGWHHWHPPFAAGNTGLIFRDLAGFKFQKAETHIEGDLVEYLIKFQSPGPGRFAVHITTCGTARVPEGPESDAITKWIWIERNKLFRPAGMLDSVRSTQRSTVRVEGGCGVRIRDISDGTQGTLLVVESRRNIPWTKPEDIPFDPNKELPELGGFMRGQLNAVFADGTMRTLDLAKVGAQLKWLIVRNDGHKVVLPPDREAGEE